jgi:hypothetical protein
MRAADVKDVLETAGKAQGGHAQTGHAQTGHPQTVEDPRRSFEDPILPLLRARYPQIAKDILRPLVDVFAITRNMCGGDTQKSEILLLIALRTATHPDFVRLTYEEIVSGESERYQSLSTNVRSIADSSGMPRENVRRKVAELVSAGLVERRGNKLSLCPRASRPLTPLRDSALRLVASNYRLAGGLLRLDQTPGETP